MSSTFHVHPGETVTVYATPDEPKRVTVADGEVYHDGDTLEGKRHKLSGPVFLEGAATFVGGSRVVVETYGDNPVIHDLPLEEKPKPPRKPRPSEKKAKSASKPKAASKKSAPKKSAPKRKPAPKKTTARKRSKK